MDGKIGLKPKGDAMEKVREKLVNVDTCWECPYGIYHFTWWLLGHYYSCSKDKSCKRYCGNGNIIPEWCPLSDAHPVTLRSYNIPYEKLEEFFGLFDTYKAANNNDEYCHLSKFKLWNFIIQIFPEVREGNWYIEIPTVTSAIIKEKDKNG